MSRWTMTYWWFMKYPWHNDYSWNIHDILIIHEISMTYWWFMKYPWHTDDSWNIHDILIIHEISMTYWWFMKYPWHDDSWNIHDILIIHEISMTYWWFMKSVKTWQVHFMWTSKNKSVLHVVMLWKYMYSRREITFVNSKIDSFPTHSHPPTPHDNKWCAVWY